MYLFQFLIDVYVSIQTKMLTLLTNEMNTQLNNI